MAKVKIIKLYDCSNSPESSHAVDYGPRENDIIRGLKDNARLFLCKFVNRYNNADIIITNDIFPEEIKKSKIPKIKRMDGIYWQNDMKHKNIALNQSAEIADHVIFISEYSRRALYTLYPNIKLKNSSVVLNTGDNKIFKGLPKYHHPSENLVRSAIASCTDWSRPEKRFNDLMQLAKLIPEKLYLIGNCEMETPPNVVKLGYLSDYDKVNEALNNADVFINLSYRDAAAKVVTQAVACGLPVLYAESGGVGELIDNGVSIPDEKEIFFADEVPPLDPVDMLKSYNYLKQNYLGFNKGNKRNFLATITNYYQIILQYGNREKILD